MKGEIVYEYGKNPVNWGRLEAPDFTHEEKNLSCGEEVIVDFCFGEDDTVEEIGFEAEGRLVTIAAMSILSEELEGEPLAKIESIDKDDLMALLEVEQLSPRRLKSAVLGLLACKNAYRRRHELKPLDFGDLIEESDDDGEDEADDLTEIE